jgi:radical SAM-linked protein
MRVGTLTPEVIDQIKRVRKTGFTVAPEAGTDRLREVINKGITEQDLLATCRDAFGAGWNLIKLYFMVGLPTETMQDVEAIVELAKKARAQTSGRGRIQINVSVATFVPKPHTPFQWHEQLNLEQAGERIDLLKKLLPRKGFRLKWHDPHTSVLEGVFSRGDRRLSMLIETAWRDGVRLDGWSEHFRLQNWQQAAAECDIDLDTYLRARDMDAPLPWDHLDCGVDKAFLKDEYGKALQREYTPDCRNHGCQQCGLCDFKTIFPRTNKKTDKKSGRASMQRTRKVGPADEQGFRYQVRYARLGDSRLLGHLELLQLVFRALRRAGLPVLFSKGYNPSPKVSFSQALPLGMESLAEFFLVDLAHPLADIETTRLHLDGQFPQTIHIQAIELAEKKKISDQEALYRIRRSSLPQRDYSQVIDAFLTAETRPIERVRKGKRKILDIRPLVLSVREEGEVIEITLLHPHGRAGVGPYEAMEHVLGLSGSQARATRVLKTSMRPCRD